MTAQEIIDKIYELKKETPDADSVIMPYSNYQTLLDGFYEIYGMELPTGMRVLGLEIIYFHDDSCSRIYLHKNIPIKSEPTQ